MKMEKGRVFNLWNTNGRRSDVVNAIELYLHILNNLYTQYPLERWIAYPHGILQYLFYKEAINVSPEVFQDHSHFDIFEQSIVDNIDSFLSKNLQLDDGQKKNLDTNIEQRARHYTSNLVRFGFTDKDRCINPVGRNLLAGQVKRDKLEELLPITDTNLILFRQLLKIKIYTEPDESGNRVYYSPCLYALYLLLNYDSIDINYFKHQVQGISPYWKDQINLDTLQQIDIVDLIKREMQIPPAFSAQEKVDELTFCSFIKNRKSSNTAITTYYTFYSALYNYVENPNNDNYVVLRNILLGRDSTKLEKAFGFGYDILQCGTKSRPYTYETFLEKNEKSPLLTRDINRAFYINYGISKYLDTAREYSDTTIRMLSATGLFQFSKPLVELSHKELFNVVLSHFALKDAVFGVVTNDEFEKIELDFGKDTTLTEIFNFSNDDVNRIFYDLQVLYGESTDVRSVLVNENRTKLEHHIQGKYPKNKIIELLRMFSNRQNDKAIKQYVNEDASVPTIYEFIVSIAWYYLSNKQISVYDSLNLTLNGDFEPVIHAAGGAGDIVVKYSDKVVMLEATLMNATAQKRGEWEPVLRHAINLTADSFPKKVYTLFVADQLDYNTINIWRAVAAVTLESTTTGEKTEHVIIMPFTNEHLCQFLEREVTDSRIITAIDISYDEIKANFDDTWHNKIIATL